MWRFFFYKFQRPGGKSYEKKNEETGSNRNVSGDGRSAVIRVRRENKSHAGESAEGHDGPRGRD